MKKLLSLAVAGIVAGIAGSASAAVIATNLTHTASVATSGNVVNKLFVSTSTDWTAAELLTNLSSGAFYQDSFGTNGPPNPALVAVFPSLGEDTYVATPVAGESPSTGAGAVDIGGNATGVFSTSQLNVTWSNTNTTDIGGPFMLGQFTLSNNANGSFKLLVASAGDTVYTPLTGTIVNGVMSIPEPASLSLLGLGVLGLAARRRQA